MSTPTEELRAAATLIRETASNAVKGMPLPWTTEPGWKDEVLVASSTPHLIASCRKPQADWIALMSPDKAEHLFRWLADAANDMAGAMVVGSKLPDAADPIEYCDEPDSVRAALAFARAILGRAS